MAKHILRRLSPALAAFLAVCIFSPARADHKEVEHTWKRVYYGTLDGAESLMFIERFDRAKPSLGDLDGDGDLDLIVGRGDGKLMYFQNQGSRSKPDFRLVNESLSVLPPARGNIGGEPLLLDVGANSAPDLSDVDMDGDLDLFVGSADGKLLWIENQGNSLLPVFRLKNPDLLSGRFGNNIAPRFADLNGDGQAELSLGNEAGEFWIIQNQGNRGQPMFCVDEQPQRPCTAAPLLLGKLERADNAVPAWADWDQDGDQDLFVGQSDGKIVHWRNIGTRNKGAWEEMEKRFELLDSGGYASPVFADLNNDSRADLLLMADGELAAYYERREGSQGFRLWNQSRNLLQVRRLGSSQSRIHLSAGDIDGDKKSDIVLGTRSGRLLVYKNVGSADTPGFKSPSEPLLPTPHRSFSAPALVDIDGDKDLDILVGGSMGRLELIENTGNPSRPDWRSRELFFSNIDVGSLSVPVTADLDKDGDPDLVVGNSLGNIVLYHNSGSARSPSFNLATIKFGGLKVLPNASPGLFHWDLKGEPDLVVGNRTGTLLASAREPDVKLISSRGYSPMKQAWSGLGAGEYSAPHFIDLSGDGKPDLLLGTGSGAVLYWQLVSSDKPRPKPPKASPQANVVPDAVAGLEQGDLTTGLEESPGTIGGSQTGSGREGPMGLDPVFNLEASSLEKLRLGKGTKPALADLNGDGRLDLVVGTADGKIHVLQQEGSRENPEWKPVRREISQATHGQRPAPAFADLDGDGDLDLAVGNANGMIVYWENTGSRKNPRFVSHREAPLSRRAGHNASPGFADVDSDGKLDMLVGNLKGEIMYFRRLDGKTPVFNLEQRRFIGLDVGINATPTAYDLTRTGKPSLVLGSDQGPLTVLSVTGTNQLYSSGWKNRNDYLEGLKPPMGSHPTLGDIDGDGDADMVVGSDKGPLTFYRNNALSHNEGAPR
ncbi:MAG: FG-GAP and VCBS repeat-containing protein [Deltaproteobacteria bacterium]|nr:FG-GAP and VCBS repeat-containing protein [Deltaproteobacteria bacterium]